MQPFTAASAGIENFFFEAGIEIAPGELAPNTFTPEQKRRVLEKAAHYGIRFLREHA